jgi:hypothetical protein
MQFKRLNMERLTEEQYKELILKTEVIEKDQFGEKVLRYSDGSYMKIFRLKRFFSSALIYPYWRRFVRNAYGLKRKKIPTIEKIVSIVSIPHLKKTGVLYLPLVGDTLKTVLNENKLTDDLIFKFGEFVAILHHKGIYFSSLHLGNVVLTKENAFGLIDISDMRIVPFPIPLFTKKANLDYLFRCRQGMKLLSSAQREKFIAGYVKQSPKALKAVMQKDLEEKHKKLQG